MPPDQARGMARQSAWDRPARAAVPEACDNVRRTAAAAFTQLVPAAGRHTTAGSMSERIDLDMVAAVVPEGVVVTDSDGKVVYINSLGAAMIGRRPADCIGRPAVECVHPADAALVRGRPAALRGGRRRPWSPAGAVTSSWSSAPTCPIRRQPPRSPTGSGPWCPPRTSCPPGRPVSRRPPGWPGGARRPGRPPTRPTCSSRPTRPCTPPKAAGAADPVRAGPFRRRCRPARRPPGGARRHPRRRRRRSPRPAGPAS